MVSQTDRHWVFRVPHIQAQQVFLTGEFNDWSRSATPMTETAPGVWEVMIHLKPGDYSFRYVTDDGRWFTDYAAFGVVRNPYGDWDSVVYVPGEEEVSPRRDDQDAKADEVDISLNEYLLLVGLLIARHMSSACIKRSDKAGVLDWVTASDDLGFADTPNSERIRNNPQHNRPAAQESISRRIRNKNLAERQSTQTMAVVE